jgi:hypothetical protein
MFLKCSFGRQGGECSIYKESMLHQSLKAAKLEVSGPPATMRIKIPQPHRRGRLDRIVMPRLGHQ